MPTPCRLINITDVNGDGQSTNVPIDDVNAYCVGIKKDTDFLHHILFWAHFTLVYSHGRIDSWKSY